MSIASWASLPPENFEVTFCLIEEGSGLVHVLCEVSTREWDESGPNHSESLLCENPTYDRSFHGGHATSRTWRRLLGGRPVSCLGCIAEMGAFE